MQSAKQGELWQELAVEHHWFHIVRGMIINGDLKRIGVNAWAAYCIIKAHTALNDGESTDLTVPAIAEMMGASKATTERAIKVLVDEGVVTRYQKPGRRNSLYKIKESIPMTLNGEVIAKGERDYTPMGFANFVETLKEFAKTGVQPSDGNVTINFTVNVINQGDNGSVHIGDIKVDAGDKLLGDAVKERTRGLLQTLGKL